MTFSASVNGDEKLRLFVGFSLAESDRERISHWQKSAFVSERIRPVALENLHITVAFLGPTPARELDVIAGLLESAASGVAAMPLELRRYRQTRSVGMLVFDDPTATATRLAGEIQLNLDRLGLFERESRPWLPHVTVCRFRQAPRLHPALPELGAISPSGVAAYHSLLRRDGAQYVVLHSVALGGRC